MKTLKLGGGGDNAPLKHTLIIGDNYKALLNLSIQYRGEIKMIYIDPPYGKDSMGQFAETNYNNSLTRDNLLSMLEPRLRLAKSLLRDDGVIFCSIDDKNQAYVKLLFDEVFGEENFVENLIWLNKEGGGKSDSKFFRTKHEYILCYAKNIIEARINGIKVKDIDRYKLSDDYENERGKYQLVKLDSGSLGYVKSLDYPIEYMGHTFYAGSNKSKWEERQKGGSNIKDWGWRWRWSKEKLKWGIDNGFIEIKQNSNGEWNIYTKQYLNCDSDGNIVPRVNQPLSYLEISSTTQANRLIKEIFEQVVFTYTKPVDLIKYLIQISTNSDDKNAIILDFFAGSGTTGQAVLECNKEDGGRRKFILVQLPESLAEGSVQEKFCKTQNLPSNLASITYERLKRVMTGKSSNGESFPWSEKNTSLGGGLDCFEIKTVSSRERVKDKSAFEVIDETLYGREKCKSIEEKVAFVCENFENATKVLCDVDKSSKED